MLLEELAAAAAKPLKRAISISLLDEDVVGVLGDELLETLKLCKPAKGNGEEMAAAAAAAAAVRLRLESMAFMATKAGDMPGKRLPKKGLRGNMSCELPRLVSMSRVNPGYKKGRMLGKRSGVISSCSRSGGEGFEEGVSLDSSEETEKILGFLGAMVLGKEVSAIVFIV